jgi:hypothetical protein
MLISLLVLDLLLTSRNVHHRRQKSALVAPNSRTIEQQSRAARVTLSGFLRRRLPQTMLIARPSSIAATKVCGLLPRGSPGVATAAGLLAMRIDGATRTRDWRPLAGVEDRGYQRRPADHGGGLGTPAIPGGYSSATRSHFPFRAAAAYVVFRKARSALSGSDAVRTAS